LVFWPRIMIFDFTIDGYDADGRKVAMQFKFKNNKPVKRLTSELYHVSGLAMGRQRSIKEIQAIESGEAPLNAMEGTIEPALVTKSKQKKLDCGRVLQDYGCNYDEYLAANPSVKAWAEKNPGLAAKERVRLGALTQEEIQEQAKPKTKSLQRLQPSLGSMERQSSDPYTGNRQEVDQTPSANQAINEKSQDMESSTKRRGSWMVGE